MSKTKKVLTAKQAMNYLGIGSHSMYKLLNNKDIQAKRIGTKWLIPIESLENFLFSENLVKNNIMTNSTVPSIISHTSVKYAITFGDENSYTYEDHIEYILQI